MAPATPKSLVARDDCDTYGSYCYYSTWNTWGRWVALVLIALFLILLGLTFTTRRRRLRGMAPMYGTGWMGGKPPVGQQHGHTGNWGPQQQGGYQAPPPPYMGNQATGTTFQSHDGYYGNPYQGHGQQGGGIELQQPGASYQPQRGGENVYDAPMGPPPGKGDGIIR